MQPVKEAYWLSEAWRKKNLRYFPYYGRGLIQITWKENYKKAGDKLEIDLVNSPDDALDLPTAVEIMFSGMEDGWFTGKKLSDYPSSYKQSRRIVNGLDKADVIAGYAERFEKSIEAAN
jgi:predicted chitinase